MRSDKKIILLFTDWYYPGYKAGGPIQSCFNLVKSMVDDFSFYILTSDRDLGDKQPYPGIKTGQWINGTNGEQVLYLNNKQAEFVRIRKFIQKLQPDVVYFNSMFSLKYTLLPRLVLKSIRYKGKIVLAPRGMLHSGAMGLKAKKKNIFLNIFRLMRLQKKIHFHATDEQEINDIKKYFPGAQVMLAENIPRINEMPTTPITKEPGFVKLVFISRLHPKKNILFLIKILNSLAVTGKIILDIYGDAGSDMYTMECRQIASSAPESISIQFKGSLPNHEVFDKLAGYHAFVLPTLGENFGHAIFEAMISGRPVLISDQTPWRNLEINKAGWDIPLSDTDQFKAAIYRLLEMDQISYDQYMYGARNLAETYYKEANYKEKYARLFS